MGKARGGPTKEGKGESGKKCVDSASSKNTRSTNTPVFGLNNLGNTCYLNAIVQVLLQTPELFSEVKHAGPLSTQLLMLFGRVTSANKAKKRSKGGGCVTPRVLFQVCRDLCSEINDEDEMHDAHELLLFILDTLQVEHAKVDGCLSEAEEGDCVYGNRKNLEFYFGHHREKLLLVPEEPCAKEVVSDLFKVEMKTSIKCERCGNVSSSTSDHNVVSLPVIDDKRSKQTIQGCFEELGEEAYVENFSCDNCKKRKGPREGAFLEEQIVLTSDILVVHLKRFLYNIDHNGVVAVKLNTNITVNPMLHVESESETVKFNAYATVCHHGKCLDSGHYVAHVKASDECWYHCSDDEVYRVSEEKALSPESYIVFYRREQYE